MVKAGVQERVEGCIRRNELGSERADGLSGNRLECQCALENVVETPVVIPDESTSLAVRDCAMLQKRGVTDPVLLYFTRNADTRGERFSPEFIALETAMRRSSERSLKLAASLSDAEAETLLSIDKKRKIQDSPSSAADQVRVAAESEVEAVQVQVAAGPLRGANREERSGSC